MNAYIGQEDLDQDDDGQIDLIEIEKLAFERQKLAQEDLHVRLDLLSKQNTEQSKAQIEREKIRGAKEIEQMKSKTAIKVAKSRPRPAAKKK